MTIYLPHRDVELREGRPARTSKSAVMAAPVEVAMHPHVYRIALVCWVSLLAIFLCRSVW
jgi:hypothetical protein